MSSFRVETFDPGMLDALVRMWRQSFEHGVGVSDPHPIEEQIEYFKTQVQPTHHVRVAMQDDTLVGFLASNPESVAQLYVRVQSLGQGIGSCLIDLAKSGSSGSLWLYTFARNLRARRFYEYHGFVAVAHGFEPMWQLEDVRYEWKRSRTPVVSRHRAARQRASG